MGTKERVVEEMMAGDKHIKPPLLAQVNLTIGSDSLDGTERYALWDLLLAADPVAHLLVDQGGDVLYANPVAQELFSNLRTDAGLRSFGLVLQNGEVEMVQKDGRIGRFSLTMTKVIWEGEPAYAVTVLDISEKQEQERMLRLLSRVFTEASDGMTVTDTNGTILNVNRAFTRTTGYEASEALGQNPRILQSDRHGRDFYIHMWSDLRQYGHWAGEIWNKRKNGEIYPEWLEISAIYDSEGELSHYVAVFRDISDQMRLLAELRLAGELQRKMLRESLRQDNFQVQILFYPLEVVSGDYADYRWFSQMGHLNGCLFDVMGHGMVAGTLVSGFRVLYRQVAERELSVNDQMGWLNQECSRLLPEDMFAAALLFKFYPDSGDFVWSGAGITKFLIYSGGKVYWQTSKGMFLGIVSTVRYEAKQLTLQKGDWIALLSDGFTDVLEELEQTGKLILSGQIEELSAFLQRLTEEGQVRDDATAMLLTYG